MCVTTPAMESGGWLVSSCFLPGFNSRLVDAFYSATSDSVAFILLSSLCMKPFGREFPLENLHVLIE